MCFVWLSEQTVNFALYIMDRAIFMTEMESVYCAVRTESLYIIQIVCALRVKQAEYEKHSKLAQGRES
jgi:hypothetical protein